MRERPFVSYVNLRGNSDDARFTSAADRVLGVGLPLEPNTVVPGDDLSVLWLGPDEWLVATPPDRQAELPEALREQLRELRAAVTDVSAGQTSIRLRGDHARDVLAKGCSLDLHARAFGPGRCAQTNVAKIMALIWQIDDAPTFDLIVRRSFADYLARWLEDAGQEYRIHVVAPEAA